MHFPPHNFSQVEQLIDFGRGVHIHAHAGHFLEFKTHWTGDVLLENIQCSFESRHLSGWEDHMIMGPGPRT